MERTQLKTTNEITFHLEKNMTWTEDWYRYNGFQLTATQIYSALTGFDYTISYNKLIELQQKVYHLPKEQREAQFRSMLTKNLSENQQKKYFLVVDLETSALEPDQGEILEIGIVKVDYAGNILGEWTELFDLENKNEKWTKGTGAVHIHKIYPKMLEGKRSFTDEAVQQKYSKILNDPGAIFVAHNVGFEHKWLNYHLNDFEKFHQYDGNPVKINRYTVIEPICQSLDTVNVCRLLLDTKANSLKAFVEALGEEYDKDSHRALVDAKQTAKALTMLLKQLPEMSKNYLKDNSLFGDFLIPLELEESNDENNGNEILSVKENAYNPFDFDLDDEDNVKNHQDKLSPQDEVLKNRILETYNPKLSEEQERFIELSMLGKNVIVDACVGSGKTTSIQALCEILSAQGKSVLYLTYNKLLKIEAKAKIKDPNVTVTNYHGFVWQFLARNKNISVSVSESIDTFNKLKPPIKFFDVLIIDEYQDINTEIAEMLEYVKSTNLNMQVIAVGDMEQKIYDFTTLDVKSFISGFVESAELLSFTQCFRLSPEYAELLSKSWSKPITGVNENLQIEYKTINEVAEFLKDEPLENILVLGHRTGQTSELLNMLENKDPKKFNKNTVFFSLAGADISPNKSNAIFTTFDSSKGMERPICILFEFDEKLLDLRAGMPDADPAIIRNIFLVAASRGKKKIIFVKPKARMNIEPDKLGFIPPEKFVDLVSKDNEYNYPAFFPSDMFDFKYFEEVEKCYDMLKIKKIELADKEVIDIPTNDGLLDLSSCIGNYGPATFFRNNSVKKKMENNKKAIQMSNAENKDQLIRRIDNIISELSILENDKGREFGGHGLQWEFVCLAAQETNVMMFLNGVKDPYISKENTKRITDRLHTLLDPTMLNEINLHLQVEIPASFDKKILFSGAVDVMEFPKHTDLNKQVIWELKFVHELSHIHFLQLGMYLLMSGVKNGRLWNVKTNELYEVQIPDRNKFLQQVVKTITKGSVSQVAYSDKIDWRNHRTLDVLSNTGKARINLPF